MLGLVMEIKKINIYICSYIFQIDHNSKGGSPSTGSEDGGPNESLNAENEFDPFLENIPDDPQDTEEPDSGNNTFLTAPPENQ